MKMHFYIVVVTMLIAEGCSTNCTKRTLPPEAKEWFNPFKVGQKWVYESNFGRLDTLTVFQLEDFITDCNQFEQGPNQFQIMNVRLNSKFFGEASFFCSITESNIITRDFVFSEFRGFFQGKEIEKCLNKIKLKNYQDSLLVYSINNTTTVDFNRQNINAYSWSKEHGLVIFETNENEIFELLEVN